MKRIQIKQLQTDRNDYPGGDDCVLLKGYSYSLQEIYAARDAGQILCLRMETNDSCNLKCIYCYSYLRRKEQKEMPFEDACDVIDQGIDLGLHSIVYLGGGEPLLYKHFWPFIEYVSRKKVIPVIFTNGPLINLNIAERLFDLKVSVVIKLDSMDEETQDLLSGRGTYKRIRAGLDALLKAGFGGLTGRYTRLGIGLCATKVNLLETPRIWRFARENNFFPNVELATEIGKATPDITLEPNQARWLRQTLREIDEKEFNIKWSAPYSSIPAHSCGIFLPGAAIKADRSVALCPEMPSVANLSGKTLAEIIREPPFSMARALENNIEEPCASCKFFRLCLGGCRSKALVINKSIFACDPHCTLLANN